MALGQRTIHLQAHSAFADVVCDRYKGRSGNGPVAAVTPTRLEQRIGEMPFFQDSRLPYRLSHFGLRLLLCWQLQKKLCYSFPIAPISICGVPMEDAVQQTEGCTAHSQRVAAYCYEVAASLGLTARQQAVLRHAALEHHRAKSATGPLRGLLPISGSSASLSHQTPRQTLKDKVLDVFHGVAEVAELEVATLELLNSGNGGSSRFDEDEFGQYSELGTAALLDSELSDTLENPAVALILPGLPRACSMAQISRLAPKLPVFPKVALQVIQCLKSGDVALETLEELWSFGSSDRRYPGKGFAIGVVCKIISGEEYGRSGCLI